MRNKFCDLTITCQGKNFPVHRAFLSARSEVSIILMSQLFTKSSRSYRVRHHVSDLCWVDFDLDVPISCPAALPNSQEPRQNRAESGIPKIKVNPTQPRSEMQCLALYLATKLYLLKFSQPNQLQVKHTFIIKGLPYMTSVKFSDFLTPPCPQIHATSLTKVAYYVCF